MFLVDLQGLDRLKITQINSLQKMVWPHVFRGRNTCIVGGPLNKQGKTLSYLVPIAAKAIAEQKKIKVTPLRVREVNFTLTLQFYNES